MAMIWTPSDQTHSGVACNTCDPIIRLSKLLSLYLSPCAGFRRWTATCKARQHVALLPVVLRVEQQISPESHLDLVLLGQFQGVLKTLAPLAFPAGSSRGLGPEKPLRL
jgi:hypothetical protein